MALKKSEAMLDYFNKFKMRRIQDDAWYLNFAIFILEEETIIYIEHASKAMLVESGLSIRMYNVKQNHLSGVSLRTGFFFIYVKRESAICFSFSFSFILPYKILFSYCKNSNFLLSYSISRSCLRFAIFNAFSTISRFYCNISKFSCVASRFS
jgi:hypothetical protein